MLIIQSIVKCLTPKQKVCIHKFIHLLYRVKSQKGKVCDKTGSIQLIGKKGYDTYFGYYDITPFNSHNEFIYVERKHGDNYLRLYFQSSVTSDRRELTKSNAWNWQQGCRLRWFPNSDSVIMFNDYKHHEYLCRFLNISNNTEQTIDYPLYDINKDGSLGLTLNFERLGVMRPGYGYICKEYKVDMATLPNEGIGLIDIKDNKQIYKLNYSKIGDAIGYRGNFSDCYINHLSFSPSGSKFLFFWIQIIKGYHKASLCVFDIPTKKIIILEKEEKVSHYVWKDDDEILCTSYSSPSKCSYYLYKISTKSRSLFCPNSLNRDGHPSYVSDSILLTDTYPDKEGYQHLKLLDIKRDKVNSIVDIYGVPTTSVEYRTDLHPRLNCDRSLISFDSNIDGNRRLCVIKLSK